MKTLWRILAIPFLVMLGCATIPRSGALNVEYNIDKDPTLEPLEKEKKENGS